MSGNTFGNLFAVTNFGESHGPAIGCYSCGASIRVMASSVPVCLREPLFDKIAADIAWAMMGINAVKGVELGAGI